jgi:hypothetical protein
MLLLLLLENDSLPCNMLWLLVLLALLLLWLTS